MKIVGGGLVALATSLATASAFAWPGTLDLTFGNRGKVVTDLGAQEEARAAVLQPDGRIVVAGESRMSVPAGQFALARYNPDGALDPLFGTGGKVLTTIGTLAYAGALALQTDGKLVAAGGADAAFAIARYDASGILDPGFGSGGIVTTAIGDFAGATAVAIQPDGKIVAVGDSTTATNADFALARYDTSGNLDPTFGTGGVVITDLGGYDHAHAAALQPDGRIIVGGFFSPSLTSTDTSFALARYATDGSLDSSFGTAGTVVTGFPGQIAALALLAGGKLLAAGKASPAGFALARYNSDGSTDATFGTGGMVTSRFGNGAGSYPDAASALVIQSDGRIVAAGSAQPGYSTSLFGVMRYEADGALDQTFAPCAAVTTPFPPVGPLGARATAVLVQPDGKLVAVGTTDYDFALTRYVGSGGASACTPAASGKANLKLRSATATYHPHITWGWTGADPVVGDFGDPTAGTDLTLCVLDGSGANRLAGTTPADPCSTGGSCWRATANAYRYAVAGRLAGCLNGFSRARLRVRAVGTATIRTQGGVCGFGVPSPPLALPVVVRLQRDDGPNCWEATFSHPSENDLRQFTARSD